jgi:ATP-dependent Clp protease ATP-binding subunit ClpA
MAMADRFDKFTDRARKVLQMAQQEAQRLQHHYIGTEHLLLGLVLVGEGVAAKVLSNMGVEPNRVRSAVESVVSPGDRALGGDIGLTPGAKTVIELSVDEARRLNHHYIGTEHLLLGMVREGEGVAAGVLRSLGVDLDSVRMQMTTVLNQSAIRPSSPGRVGLVTEALSEQARGALEQALLAARWYEHRQVDTDHLLIGLMRKRACLAARALGELGADQDRLLGEFKALGQDGDTSPAPDKAQVGYTPASLAAIEHAKAEAHERHQTPANSGHLLLALLWVPESRATTLLERLSLGADAVRAALEPRLADGDSGLN